jgi:hypothetical protein
MWGTESSQAPCDRRSSLPAGSLCHPLFSVQAACLPPPTSSPCFGRWLAAVVTLLLSYLSSSSSFRITVCPHPRAHTLFSHQLFLPQLWLKNTPSPNPNLALSPLVHSGILMQTPTMPWHPRHWGHSQTDGLSQNWNINEHWTCIAFGGK